MNAEILLKHFDRISEAPDAGSRLRLFVLDLAVHGKLVEQDQNDEPAPVLLERIQTERARLAATEGIKIQRGEPIDPEDAPFDLPSSWIWVRLADICSKTGSGSTPRGGKSVYGDHGVPFLRSQNIYDDGLRLDDVAYIDDETNAKMAGTALRSDDLLLNITGGSIGRCCLVPSGLGKANVSQHVAIIRLAISGIHGYLHRLILSPYFQSFVFGEQTGAGRGGLPKNRMDRIPVALPPLAEQRRIVAKVDELIALCDRLEEAHKEREKRRARLTAASLHHLNNGLEKDEIQEHARFFINHLPRLTTRAEQTEQLRHILFNLAVRGKLLPQRNSDEAVSTALKRLRTERIRAEEAGRIKPLPTLSAIDVDNPPFSLPTSWQWIRLGQLVIKAVAGWSPRTETFPRSGDNWGVLKVSAVSWERFLAEENKQLLPKVVPPTEAQVHKGDFLISRANTSELVAKSVLVEQEPHKLILSDKIVRLELSRECSRRFVSIVNNHAAYARRYYAEEASGTSLSMKNVSRDVIYALPVPFPPLAEQQRIVAIVDELIAVCDRLEQQITDVQKKSRSLLEAVLHESLMPVIVDVQ